MREYDLISSGMRRSVSIRQAYLSSENRQCWSERLPKSTISRFLLTSAMPPLAALCRVELWGFIELLRRWHPTNRAAYGFDGAMKDLMWIGSGHCCRSHQNCHHTARDSKAGGSECAISH